MDKCDILFILPSYPEPRNTNIINAVKQKFNVKVIYWEKKKNSLTYKNSNCEVTPILIRANDHKPLLRIFRTFLFQKKLLKEITKTQPSCIHVSKLDSLLVASEYKRNKNNNVRIVYDVSDMHNLAYNDNNSFFSRMIKKQLYNFEKKCSYYVNRLLITSPKFFEAYYEYDIVGTWYKCNMTDVVAAIGLKQFERYPGMLQRRKGIITRYDNAFKPLGVETLMHYTDDYSSSGHLYITRIPGIINEQRRKIIIKMAEEGVSCNVHYKPLPMHTAYKHLGFDIKNYPNAYAHYENEVTLPLHTCLTDEEVDYIIDTFKKVLKDYVD